MLKIRIVLIIFIMLFSIVPILVDAKYSQSGVPSLMMDGYGARIMGMSGVFVGIADYESKF